MSSGKRPAFFNESEVTGSGFRITFLSCKVDASTSTFMSSTERSYNPLELFLSNCCNRLIKSGRRSITETFFPPNVSVEGNLPVNFSSLAIVDCKEKRRNKYPPINNNAGTRMMINIFLDILFKQVKTQAKDNLS